LSTRPSELLKTAKYLAKLAEQDGITPSFSSALARIAVVQSYYCVFHSARQWAVDRGYSKPRHYGSHEALWTTWYGSDKQTEPIAVRAEELKLFREEASYELDADVTSSTASEVLELAEEVIDLLKGDQARVLQEGHVPRTGWNRQFWEEKARSRFSD
jgi:uncharacterized protein (UPF0332 family)